MKFLGFIFLFASFFATFAIASENRVSPEEIFDKLQAGENLSFFEINRLNSECRIVPGTTRVLTLGGKPLAEAAGEGPVLVYIDGDAGWRDGKGVFHISNATYLTLKALAEDGRPNPEQVTASRQSCRGKLREYSYFGIPVVYAPRPGTYGTAGNYGRDIYTPRETELITLALDEMREVGVKRFILFGFSGGGQAGLMAAAGRDDIDLVVTAGGMLSLRHHSFPKSYVNDPLQLTAKMPPVLIVHSQADIHASFSGAKAFFDQMLKDGRDVEFREVDVEHFETTIEAKKILLKWLDERR